MEVESDTFTLKGMLSFDYVIPPSYSIMGPFHMLPFMECQHSVFSLFHHVNGQICLNKKEYVFENSTGYMEGDRGTSFPKRYVWTHCNYGNNSIMLSVAHIPYSLFSFTGCIGFIYWNKKEYWLATYCGVKLLHVSDNMVILKQGKLFLQIKLLSSNSQLLYAPLKGSMSRFIRESASCHVQYTCMIGEKIVFDFISDQASYENNW